MKSKCDFCATKDTVFLTQIVDGQMKKICLCESCAKEKGVTDPTGFSLADMLLTGMPIAQSASSSSRVSSSGNGKKCPACGFTADDLNRVRRFGCSECFTAFGDQLELILRGMHAGITHTGKIPKGFEILHAREEKIEQLRLALDDAIAKEHYEDAAHLRDEINALTSFAPRS